MLNTKNKQLTKENLTEQIGNTETKISLKRLKASVYNNYERVEKKTGLSKTTVCSVLNGDCKSEETCEKVIVAAKEVAEELRKEKEKKKVRLAKIITS